MTQLQKNKSSKAKKIASSGLRVLELLKALMYSPLTPTEMLKIIEEKSDDVFRIEIVSKYLNTLKLAGLEVVKIKDKYILERSIERIDFSEIDLSVLKFLENYTREIKLETLNANVSDALQTIERNYSNKTFERINNSEIKVYKIKKPPKIKDSNIKNFEKYCKEALKLEILYQIDPNKTVKNYKIAPLKILYKNRKAVLIAYDCVNSEHKEFLLDCIVQAKQTPQKNTKDYPATVTYRLKGRLAKSYVLKNDEKVIVYEKDAIIVSNSKEDKDLLIRRLLRYFDQCEILYPKICREKMQELIENIQKIYE